MKKATQILVAIVLSLGIIGVGNVAHAEADTTCDSIVITNTGAGSYNEGVCTVNVKATVTCTNNIYVLDDNSQQAVSGAASDLGNTTSGTVTTGNATNSNGQSVQIGASCGQAAVTPETPATPASPSTPVVPVVATPKPVIAALPYTASGSVAPALLTMAVAVAGIAVTSRLVVMAHRRASK